MKKGHVTVSIYNTSSTTGSKTYDQFVVVYYEGEKRIRRKFSSFKAAKCEAELIASRLVSGDSEALKITGKDRSIYLHAVQQLKPLNIPLNVAISEYVQATTLLPPDFSLIQCVKEQLQTKPETISKQISEVVEEFLNNKTKAGRSDRHLKDLRNRLIRFAGMFQMPIQHLDASMIQSFIDSIKATGRTRLNYLRPIVSLVRFAVRRNYASRNLLEQIESIDKPEVKPTITKIFTPEELDEILASIRTSFIPWIAIGAFTGLRTAEIMRLDWKDIHLHRKFVEVKAANAKTAARRIVPLCQKAIDLLTPHEKPNGPFTKFKSEGKFYTALSADINEARRTKGLKKTFKWKHNALRHSFCSYRLALTQDVGKTSMEAGNSPAMIFRHYRELVSIDEAKMWFKEK